MTLPFLCPSKSCLSSKSTGALPATTAPFNQEKTITDFQSFRNAVLENDDLQEAVISIINTATANGSGLSDEHAVITSGGLDSLISETAEHLYFFGKVRYERQPTGLAEQKVGRHLGFTGPDMRSSKAGASIPALPKLFRIDTHNRSVA